jgi:uncharacterized protein YegL
MEIAAVEACKKSPRADNIMIRLARFSSAFYGNIEEVHGFKPLADIDTASYPPIVPGGMTPLVDADYSGTDSILVYGEHLADQDYGVNGIAFVITDGGENASVLGMAAVKRAREAAVQSEKLESLVSILVGINTAACGAELQTYQREAGMTQYVDAGDATPQRLAKLADFVSKSVSSTSQALGSGGPSQNIAATI